MVDQISDPQSSLNGRNFVVFRENGVRFHKDDAPPWNICNLLRFTVG
jgi:hypothetical protein